MMPQYSAAATDFYGLTLPRHTQDAFASAMAVDAAIAMDLSLALGR